jgi:hypothetical protein
VQPTGRSISTRLAHVACLPVMSRSATFLLSQLMVRTFSYQGILLILRQSHPFLRLLPHVTDGGRSVLVRGITYMGLRPVSGHPLCSSARPCAVTVSHVRRTLRSNGKSESACLPVISHSPFCKRMLVFASQHPPRLLTLYRAPLVASYHSILVLFLTALTSGVFYLMTSNLSLPICVSVLLVMRIYALYFRNRWILFIVTLEFIAGFLLACVSTAVDNRKYLCVDFASGLLLNCCLE